MGKILKNKTFTEINIGDTASVQHVLTHKDIQLFAVMSGDVNPAHLDQEYARSEMFHKIIAHGMWSGALISNVLGTQLPGAGSIYLGQTFKFLKPIGVGDMVTAQVTVTAKDEKKKTVKLDCICFNQHNEKLIVGEAEIMAPTKKVRRKQIKLPEISFKNVNCPFHNQIIDMAKDLKPLQTAVIYPVDAVSLRSAIMAMQAGIIEVTLLGPKKKMQQIAKEEDLDLSSCNVIDVAYGHMAAAKAVEMVHAGKVEALMKGMVHTDELLHVVTNKEKGLRTSRFMSHVAMLDVPNFSRPLFITDAMININPDLSRKIDIVQNAIDLYTLLGYGTPRVALLSAVETVNQKLPSTLDATALCKMAERGQITDAILDGPLAFDNAISPAAAARKNLQSQVAGEADILVVPDLESGNMLSKQLMLLSDAHMAGVVVGSKVPIIFTSFANNDIALKSSCALALLIVRRGM